MAREKKGRRKWPKNLVFPPRTIIHFTLKSVLKSEDTSPFDSQLKILFNPHLFLWSSWLLRCQHIRFVHDLRIKQRLKSDFLWISWYPQENPITKKTSVFHRFTFTNQHQSTKPSKHGKTPRQLCPMISASNVKKGTIATNNWSDLAGFDAVGNPNRMSSDSKWVPTQHHHLNGPPSHLP